MDVGVECESLLRLDLEMVGYHYQWTGALPGAPNFDFRFKDVKNFTPFNFGDPAATAVTLATHNPPQSLYAIPLTDAFIPIPKLGGYLELRAGGNFTATLEENRLTTTLGEITRTQPTLSWETPENAELPINAAYQAQVAFQTELLLEPALVVTVGPWKWDLASFTLPIPLPRETESWAFTASSGVFQLPRLEVQVNGETVDPLARTLVIDLGEAAIDETTERTVVLRNVGKAPLSATASLSGAGFTLGGDFSVELAPGLTDIRKVTLTRVGDGSFEGHLLLEPNDPYGPINVTFRGRSKLPPDAALQSAQLDSTATQPAPDPRALLGASGVTGCGCSSSTDNGPLVFLALGLLAWARRRGTR
jgi:MYXO-CTERM domain-containing protein